MLKSGSENSGTGTKEHIGLIESVDTASLIKRDGESDSLGNDPPFGDYQFESAAETKLEKCPNSKGDGGDDSVRWKSTEACSDGSIQASNQFSYSPPGRAGGASQGGGDREDDDRATDYKRKWLDYNTKKACSDGSIQASNRFSYSPHGRAGGAIQGGGDKEDDDRATDYVRKWLDYDQNKIRTTWDMNERDTSKESLDIPRLVTNCPPASSGTRSAGSSNGSDASMEEQAELLQKEWTNQKCLVDQVTFSHQYGSFVAFMKRLHSLRASGSSVRAGCSEGVISNENLTLNHDSQYRFEEEFVSTAELGQGDFGTTRACLDQQTRQMMATKEIRRERFLPFEVLSLAKLRSPFIVRLLGATAEECALFVHMELVDNARSLEWLAGVGASQLSNQDRVIDICFQLISALGCLFDCSMLHRDLNCRNVLLTGDRVKVIDLGHAVPAPYEQGNAMQVGVMWYLAPEITEGARLLTCKSDLWSCAIIILSLLRGLPEGDVCERTASRGSMHPLKCSHLSHIHPALLDLLRQMLAVDPKMRPKPSGLALHRVFGDDMRKKLERYPTRISPDSSDLRQAGSSEDSSRDGTMSLSPGDSPCKDENLGAGEFASGTSEISHSAFSRNIEASSETGHGPIIVEPPFPNQPMWDEVGDPTSVSLGDLPEDQTGNCPLTDECSETDENLLAEFAILENGARSMGSAGGSKLVATSQTLPIETPHSPK